MIEARELRIGNKVYLFDDEAEKSPWIIDVTTQHIDHPEYIAPIPITSKILDGCGFQRTDIFSMIYPNRKFWKKGLLIFEDCTDGSFGFYIDGKTESPLMGFYYYIHQLQNLYFALVQKEMEITL